MTHGKGAIAVRAYAHASEVVVGHPVAARLLYETQRLATGSQRVGLVIPLPRMFCPPR